MNGNGTNTEGNAPARIYLHGEDLINHINISQHFDELKALYTEFFPSCWPTNPKTEKREIDRRLHNGYDASIAVYKNANGFPGELIGYLETIDVPTGLAYRNGHADMGLFENNREALLGFGYGIGRTFRTLTGDGTWATHMPDAPNLTKILVHYMIAKKLWGTGTANDILDDLLPAIPRDEVTMTYSPGTIMDRDHAPEVFIPGMYHMTKGRAQKLHLKEGERLNINVDIGVAIKDTRPGHPEPDTGVMVYGRDRLLGD